MQLKLSIQILPDRQFPMKYLQYTDVVLSLRVLYNNLPSFLKKQGIYLFL